MAIQTMQHSSFNDGQVRVEFDLNDSTWFVTKFRCINNSDFPCIGRILNNGVEVYTVTAPPHKTSSWNVANIKLGWDPVDGGLMMGTYSIQVVWPA